MIVGDWVVVRQLGEETHAGCVLEMLECLGMFWLCFSYALVMLWECSGYALGMLWLCFGYVLVMF